MPVTVMELKSDAEAAFRRRPNRFLAVVDIEVEELKEIEAHVHDPGRLTELLYPGNRLLLRRAHGTSRKTKWDVIAARYEGKWIPVHSGLHRQISEWVLHGEHSPFGTVEEIRPEVTVGHSRLDFVLTLRDGRRLGVEVKGCTLAVDGTALFPDAPTERGRRHLETLMEIREEGGRAALMVLIFRPDARCFSPNGETDPKFAETFKRAVEKGVEVYPVVFRYDGERVEYVGRIPVCGDG